MPTEAPRRVATVGDERQGDEYMRLSERRLLPDRHRKSQSARAAIVAMVVVLALAAPASAGITLVSTPDALVQLYEEVTVTWAKSSHMCSR